LVVTLCDFQETALNSVLAALNAARSALPSFLLIGSSGVGKHLIASQVAHQVGIEFVEVRLDLSRRDVVEILCGVSDLAGEISRTGIPQGELAHLGPRLLYMSHLELLDPSLFHTIATILNRRFYTDQAGREWRISDDLWLAAGLTLTAKSNVGPNHWLTAAFQVLVTVPDPCKPPSFQAVAENIATQYSTGATISSEVGELLAAQKPFGQNFHAVRRWIASACAKGTINRIDASSLQKAIIDDLEWSIHRIEYRGSRLERRHVERWLQQMDPKFHSIALRLVWLLAQKYFINVDEYYRALGILIDSLDIKANRLVSFCKWQPLGRSAPHITHDLKNRAHWKIGSDVDFGLPESAWPKIPVSNPIFVLADDFVGTGLTVSRLSKKGSHSPMMRLASKYPNASFALLLVVAYEESLADAIASINRLLARPIDVYVYRLLTTADQCFSPASTMVPSSSDQLLLKQLCIWARSKYFRTLESKHVFGFEQTGSFFAFFNSVPNNSLPILWHDQADWCALLPSSGILT
jgi:hypothetical protein